MKAVSLDVRLGSSSQERDISCLTHQSGLQSGVVVAPVVFAHYLSPTLMNVVDDRSHYCFLWSEAQTLADPETVSMEHEDPWTSVFERVSQVLE